MIEDESRGRVSSSSTYSVGLRLEQNHSKQAFFAEELCSELYCHSAENSTSSHYKLKYEQIQQTKLTKQQVLKGRDKQESNIGPVLSMQPEKPKNNWLQEKTAPKEAEATPWHKLCVD